MHLHDWEIFLAPYLPKIELLSEIPLERSAHAELEQALSVFVSQHGLTEATRRMERNYPTSFVTYLAFKAAFNDERGFWDGVAKAIGLDNKQLLFHYYHHWGQTFLKIIKQHPNLRRFADISSLEYVTPIRLHGGIPAFSLPDFFQHILLPSIEKAPYDGMDDDVALKTLLERYTTDIFVDDVVRYFFLHAGEPARRFFTKCRQMARQAQTNQSLCTPEALGLRPYVVQLFESFREKQTTPSLRRRRPRLIFDPYTPAFRVILPAQPLSLEQASSTSYDARLYDPVTGTVYAEQNRLRPHRQGQEWLIDEVEWVLEEPCQTVQVGLFVHGELNPILSYTLHILPPTGYPPLLAFRYGNERLVPISPSLPARSLWLFYPNGVELSFKGSDKPLEKLHPFAPPWQGWQATAWDVGQTRLVRLLRESQDICAPIAVSRPLEPVLSESGLPAHLVAVDEKPLYAAAPQVCLPIQTPDMPHVYFELEDWQLHLESRYAAAPQGSWQAKAGNMSFAAEGTEARISLLTWLGASPVGTYHLTISRRGRTVAELPFRVCAGLQIHNLQPYYLPNEQGAQPVNFILCLPANARPLAEDNTEITAQPNEFSVCVPAEAAQADLRIELHAVPEPVRIPLRVAIPRLRWAMVLEKGTALEWTHQPIARSLAELLQVDLALHRPRLRVEIPSQNTKKPLVELHLTAPGRDKPLQTSASRSLANHCLEFDLSAFFDTLRVHTEESVFELCLEVLDVEQDLNLTLPVIRLSRDLDIRACHFEAKPQGRWCLHWCEPRPLRHRRLRLWSRWQPWANPLEIPLLDDAQPSDNVREDGWWMYIIPSEIGLQPSEYWANFVVVSPYENSRLPPSHPEQATPMQMLAPELRLREIETELAKTTLANAFALHFEKLCIHQTQKQDQESQNEIQWCLKHWRDAKLLHLECIARWLGQCGLQENQPAFLMYIFREEILKRLEEESHSLEFVNRYLSLIAHARTIHPNSVRHVLAMAREPDSILHALRLLIKSDAEEARKAFWEFLEQGRFSESDAAILLKSRKDFVYHLLKDTPQSPLRYRFLRELSRYMDLIEYVIKVGYYVLCDAGWVKIVEIHNASQNDLFLPDQENPKIIATLWGISQQVEIDLSTGMVMMKGQKWASVCGCKKFIAPQSDEFWELWREHTEICSQASNCKKIQFPYKTRNQLKYKISVSSFNE